MPQLAPAVVGRVLYVSHGSPLRPDDTKEYPPVSRAADITEQDPDHPFRVGLSVLNPTGLISRPLSEGGALYDASGTAAESWHWPEWV